MGGCRCVYRTCQSSTTLSPGLHYFHFPVRDPDRCEQWIANARKPMLRAIPRDKLRNKVICSLHFEERCFTNEKHDRLIHNAVPTLGFDDAPEDYSSFANQNDSESKDDSNIMLIPINEDNTKFALPDVGFSGMSYTIYDDAVIPSSNLPLLMNQDKNKVSIIVKKDVENKAKRQKFTVTSINKVFPPKNSDSTVIKENNFEFNNGSNIMSYSVSTCGDDVTLELSKQTKNDLENAYHIDENTKSDAPLLDNDISLKPNGDNQFSMSVVTTPVDNNVQQHNVDSNMSEESRIPEVYQKNDFCNTREQEYIQMIKNNSRQIVELKKLVNKQNRLHKYLLQRKQLCKFKKRRLNKFRLLQHLKYYVKPSLMAILKLEILPTEDVVLTDSEEKFITDLYTENPECYNLLLRKYKWKLPESENLDNAN